MIWGDSARVLRAVLRNSALQRALIGFTLFWTAECGVWVAILVYGYEVGGAAGAAVSALIGLIPSTLFALVASPLVRRERWGAGVGCPCGQSGGSGPAHLHGCHRQDEVRPGAGQSALLTGCARVV